MTKRVQLIRHDNAGTQTFLGKIGELTVNTGNKSVIVHNGINQGGTEQARADLVNVAVAAAGNAGKMSAQQSVDLAQALLDIITNTASIVANDASIVAALGVETNNRTSADNTLTTNLNTEISDRGAADTVITNNLNAEITNRTNADTTLTNNLNTEITNRTNADNTLTTNKADKKVPASVNNLAGLDASGNLTDSGLKSADFFFIAGGGINYMVFQQSAAPTGWTKQVTHNNKAFRVVTGAAGSGGSVAFTTAFASKSVTGSNSATALSIAQMPAHSHTHPIYNSNAVVGDRIPATTFSSGGGTATSSSVGSGATHNHTFTGTAINMAVQYVDLIIASKD